MFRTVTRILSNVDIFGSSVQLSFQKSSVYQSKLGGVFSIFLVAILGIFFWKNVFLLIITFYHIYPLLIMLLLFNFIIDNKFLEQISICGVNYNKTYFILLADVKVTTQKTFDSDPSVITLDTENYMFAINFDQKDFLVNPYYNISVHQAQIVTLQNGTKSVTYAFCYLSILLLNFFRFLITQLTFKTFIKPKQSFFQQIIQSILNLKFPRRLEPCTLNHFSGLPAYGANWTLIFNQNNLKDFLCLEKQDTYEIGGDYTTDKFLYLQFSVKDCSNKTDSEQKWKPKCRSEQELANKVSLYFPTIMVNPDDPTSSFMKSYLNTDTFFYFQPKILYKTADIFFTEYTIDTDESVLPTQSINTLKHPIYETKGYREQVISGRRNNYADFYIRRSYFSTKIDRAFTKLDEVISYVGGFAEGFLIFLAIFLHYYNECLYSVELANKLFDFDVNQQPPNHFNSSMRKSPASKNKDSQTHVNGEGSFKNKLFSLSKDFDSNKNKGTSKQNSIKKVPTSLFGQQKNISIKDDDNQNDKQNNQKQYGEDGKLFDIHAKNIPINENDDSEVLYRKKLFNACQRRQSIKLPRSINSLKVRRVSMKKYTQTKNTSFFEDQQSMSSDESSDKEDVQTSNQKSKQTDKSKQVQLKKRIRRSHLQIPARKNNQSILNHSNIYSNIKIDNSQIHEQTGLNAQFPSLFSPIASTSSKLNTSDKRLFSATRISLFSPKKIESINLRFDILNNSDKGTPENPSTNKPAVFLQIDSKQNQEEDKQKEQDLKPEVGILNLKILDEIEKEGGVEESQVKEDQTQKRLKLTNRVMEYKKSVDRLQYLKTEFKAILNRQAKIKMTFSYIIYRLSCKKLCRTKNNQLIDKSRDLLEAELDIFVILEKLKEVNKFKELFLDKQQQILFNFFPKPVIKVEEDNEFQISKGSLLQLHANTPNNKKNNGKDPIGSPTNQMNLKTFGILAQAIHKLKKGVKPKHHVPSTIEAYKKLYECYVICSKDKNLQITYLIKINIPHFINQLFNLIGLIKNQLECLEEKQMESFKNLKSIFYIHKYFIYL